jgi:aryl-alcohol dehydrogenase
MGPVEAIRNITANGVEFAIETSGDADLICRAVECLAPGGVCALIGPGGSETEVSIKLHTLLQRRTLVGNPIGASVPATFQSELLALYRRGHFPVDRLISEFRFEEINDAAEALLSGAAVKPVLVMPEAEFSM